jgi:hypothetical protein
VTGQAPNTLSLLAVVEESRQRAMQQREAAVDHLAALALQAIVQGEDVREVAKLCGFDMDAPVPAPEPSPGEGGLFSMHPWGPSAPKPSPAQGFAQWLGEHTQKLVLEGLGEQS